MSQEISLRHIKFPWAPMGAYMLWGPKRQKIIEYPPFTNHCAREKIIEELFSEGLREIVAIACAKELGELFSGGLRNVVVALCFLTVLVACFQK